MYIGSSRGLERSLVPSAGIRSFLFPMWPPTSLRGIVSLFLAALRSLLVVARVRPGATFATGGYVSVPAALASWVLRVPIVVYLPDVVPGKAVRWLVPLATRIAVTSDESLAHLPREKTSVTGYPVREVFLRTSRESGRQRFDLPGDTTVLGVFGGSQGARALNEALYAALPEIVGRAHIIHVCGEQRRGEAEAMASRLPAELRTRYQLYPYLHDEEMAHMLAAIDLALCRSGASVMGELPATGTPAVLVPFPSPAVHQYENAQFLASHGAAVVLAEPDLALLTPTLIALLDDRERLEEMARCARSLFRPDAAAAIAALVEGAA